MNSIYLNKLCVPKVYGLSIREATSIVIKILSTFQDQLFQGTFFKDS